MLLLLVTIALALLGCGRANSGPDSSVAVDGPIAEPSAVSLSASELQQVVDAAYAKYKDLKEGENADYIPILTTAPSDLFGVVIATRDGQVYVAGDIDYEFSIQSVSKPFTAALVMQQQGPAAVAASVLITPATCSGGW